MIRARMRIAFALLAAIAASSALNYVEGPAPPPPECGRIFGVWDAFLTGLEQGLGECK